MEVEAEIAKQVAKTSLLTIQRLVKTMNLHMKMLRTKQKVFKLIPRHISLDLQHFVPNEPNPQLQYIRNFNAFYPSVELKLGNSFSLSSVQRFYCPLQSWELISLLKKKAKI